MTRMEKLEPRKAVLKKILDPKTHEVIDKGLCLWFPGPNSFTGEDCVEFHVHGGTAILSALMSALSKLQFQPALPGEFTRRAFHNNKLDLTEVEGLADLIHAETEQQRKQALLQADGSLSRLYNKWRTILSNNIANLEAYIDFSEDDNIENDVLQNCDNSLKTLAHNVKKHLKDGRRGEILRDGVRTVIIGEPNVGKSSLLNHLVQRNAVIVTPIAGTTRDIIELRANIGDYPILLADTAGLTKHTTDIVESEGIRRAKSYAQNADFIVLVMDASKYLKSKSSFMEYKSKYIASLEIKDLLDQNSRNFITVMNKIDLLSETDVESLKEHDVVTISCKTEFGFPNLLMQMTNNFKVLCGDPSRENPTISQSRYRAHLQCCLECLNNYFEMTEFENYDMVIAVEEIRKAMKELGKITGHVSTEEILDIIFKNFCIGK